MDIAFTQKPLTIATIRSKLAKRDYTERELRPRPPGGAAQAVVSNATYLPFGPIQSYTLGNGQTVSRTYDANYRITDIVSPALELHFIRDATGNITGVSEAGTGSESYRYDPLYRLAGVDDPAGQAIEAYTYNKTGDRLSKTGNGLATGTYGYQPGTHWLTSIGTASRTYDANGNTTGNAFAGDAWGYGYNGRNRMTVVQRNGQTVGSYVYNSLEQRTSKTAEGTTTRFAYDEGSQLLSEATENAARDYLWLGGIPVGVLDNGGTASLSYVHADALGSPRVVTTNTGATAWRWSYTSNPFGEARPVSTTGYALNLRFPGQYYDKEAGKAYNLNRDYDALVGRYIQSDPLGLTGGLTAFAYVSNNPLTRIDPLGLDDSAAMYNPAFWGRTPPAAPDYYHLSLNYLVGSLSLTLTRSGQLYMGGGTVYGGPKSNVKVKGFGASFTSGILSGCKHTASTVDNYVLGASTGASAFYGIGGGMSYNSAGSAMETGFGTPGASYQVFENNVPVMDTGMNW